MTLGGSTFTMVGMDEHTVEVRSFLDRPIHFLGDLFGPEDDVPREVLIHFTDNSMVILTPEQWQAIELFMDASRSSVI